MHKDRYTQRRQGVGTAYTDGGGLEATGNEREAVSHTALGRDYPAKARFLLASGIMRQYISSALRHSVCSTLLQQPQETNTVRYQGECGEKWG